MTPGFLGMRRPCRGAWWAFVAALATFFAADFTAWARFGLGSSLHSYILLVPLISLWLLHGEELRRLPLATPTWAGAILGAVAVVLFLLALIGDARADFGGPLDRWRIFVAISLFAGGLFIRWGGTGWRLRLFPVLFLFVMVPLSPELEHRFSMFLQWSSGWAAYAMIKATGTPILKNGPFLTLPGLELEVAEECSGIRSTLVLLVTALLASHLFLRRPVARTIFTLLVIPIGILRNGLRILVIAWLTVHVDPGVISGPIHRRGGPFFFLVSLAVLLVVLAALRRFEHRGNRDGTGVRRST